MKIVFMGTPDFSVPSLKALNGAGLEVRAVITQPDRPRGRGKKVLPSPVKEAALELGLPVHQPERIREENFFRLLQYLQPDVIAVVAFGRILPGEILDLPPLGCVNVHASLLPKYRGAAPIQRAIMNGDSETGVTTMKMDRGLDTGDMLLQARTPVDPEENFGAVHRRLSLMGAGLLLETLDLMAAGKLAGFPQDNEKATYAPPISREDEIIDWGRRALDIKNQVRGLDPWPGARTRLGQRVMKIWKVKEKDGCSGAGRPPGEAAGPEPGEIVGITAEGLEVQCGDCSLVIRELQLEGGKRMDAAEFLRGVKITPGVVLGRA